MVLGDSTTGRPNAGHNWPCSMGPNYFIFNFHVEIFLRHFFRCPQFDQCIQIEDKHGVALRSLEKGNLSTTLH